eukprot:1803680-Prymnesium_polylepis.1
MPLITLDCPRLPSVAPDCPRSPSTTLDHPRLPSIVARLVSGALDVRVYDDRFHAVWEQPVYFSVGVHFLLRVISYWAVAKSSRTFGLGLKNFDKQRVHASKLRAVPTALLPQPS